MEFRSTEETVHALERLYDGIQQSVVDNEVHSLLPVRTPPTPMSLSNGSNNDTAAATPAMPLTSVERLSRLNQAKDQVAQLQVTMDRYRKRLSQKDPVTDKPRYGTQTAQRVSHLLQRYNALQDCLDTIFERTPAILEQLQEAAQQQTQSEQTQATIHQQRIQYEQAQKRQRALELEQQQRVAQEQRVRQQQEAVRLEQQANRERIARERAEQQAFLDRVPNRNTIEGVREQVEVFQRAGGNLTALHQLFHQISSHPEQADYRRIRRDHPQFLQDIGKYRGGTEVLVAAGFEMAVVDDIPSYVCQEPNVEQDLDGWSAWFDLMKATVDLIKSKVDTK